MGVPKPGTVKYAEWTKYHWQWKKTHLTPITISLNNQKDADLIYDLTHFDGNRNQWLKDLLRKTLKEEGRHTDITVLEDESAK